MATGSKRSSAIAQRSYRSGPKRTAISSGIAVLRRSRKLRVMPHSPGLKLITSSASSETSPDGSGELSGLEGRTGRMVAEDRPRRGVYFAAGLGSRSKGAAAGPLTTASVARWRLAASLSGAEGGCVGGLAPWSSSSGGVGSDGYAFGAAISPAKAVTAEASAGATAILLDWRFFVNRPRPGWVEEAGVDQVCREFVCVRLFHRRKWRAAVRPLGRQAQ